MKMWLALYTCVLLARLTLALPPSSRGLGQLSGEIDTQRELTDLCCKVEEATRVSNHAILKSKHRTLVRLYQTGAYSQVLLEAYCMSMADLQLHVTVHPLCTGHCRQIKRGQEVIVVDEHGRKSVREVVVNAGCLFEPSARSVW